MPHPHVEVRVYNVRFGDCVLVSLELRGGEKHILVDFGNAPAMVRKKGGKNDVFAPIAADIAKRTGGTIDLLIMSHEHLDHMEGFFSEKKVFDRFTVKDVWMSLMSAPDYYKRYPDCEPERKARLALNELAMRWNLQGRLAWLPESVVSLIANNILSVSNSERIDYVRQLAEDRKRVHYLARGMSTSKLHTLGGDVEIEILGPERNASVYYGDGGHGFWLTAAAHFGKPSSRGTISRNRHGSRCPRHISMEEFEQLKDDVAEMDVNDLLAIDKAANNTSLVLRINVGGKTLIFPGDAEQESWAVMKSKGLIGAVDVLKIAHHGSLNGMPFEGNGSILDLLLKPRGKTTAIVSTCSGVYGTTSDTEIPNQRLMELLLKRCGKVINTEKDARPGEYIGFDITM